MNSQGSNETNIKNAGHSKRATAMQDTIEHDFANFKILRVKNMCLHLC